MKLLRLVTWRIRPLLLLAGAALATPARADDPRTVRVGYAPSITDAVGIVGFSPQKRSYYKAFPGVTFNNRLFLAGPAVIEAMRRDEIDMAFVDGGAAISAFARSPDIVVLTGTTAGGTILVGRKGVAITAAAGLQGRKVAVPEIGCTQDTLLRFLLALNGLRAEDKGGKVAVMAIDNPELPGLFLQKKIDAACVPEPWGSYLVKEAGATVILGSGQMFNEGEYPATVLVARKAFADANPRFTRKFRDVTRRITLVISSQKMNYAPLLKSEMKRLSGRTMTDASITSGLKRCRFTTTANAHDMAVFAKLVDVAGYMPPGAKLDGIMLQ
ncbi:MAG TPA: ABC transporter substrate-binding protein [Armatimonadota bacterium]|jgi:NitT/TauT family transport system substrate-binding protein